MKSKSKENTLKNVLLIVLISFVCLMYYSYLFLDGFYVSEGFVFISILVLIYYLRNPFNLSPLTLILVAAGMLSHELGMFGFYGASPLPYGLGWERVTHFLPVFAVSLLVFGLFASMLDSKRFTRKNIAIYLIVLLAACGVGAFIENVEFAGFLVYGQGEGGFRFGAGDSVADLVPEGVDELSFIVGGGYYNAMYDLYTNLVGALTGLLLMILFKKRDKEVIV